MNPVKIYRSPSVVTLQYVGLLPCDTTVACVGISKNLGGVMHHPFSGGDMFDRKTCLLLEYVLNLVALCQKVWS